MSNIYIAYHFKVSPKQIGSEILIAELGELLFESFEETDDGLSAYIQKSFWNETILEKVEILKNSDFEISFHYNEIAPINWNQEWEKNFEPIDVDGLCYIRAPFHEKTNSKYDIVIEPKMSFGTGHHETTHMMIQHLLAMDVTNMKTLDMGCGTAILAILADMKGAKPIDAIDIDNWCFLNSIENAARNNCHNIAVFEGDASLLILQKYDLIIANINRNILLSDMATYVKCLNKGGTILFSGFYEEDIPFINEACLNNGLIFESQLQRNKWVSLKFRN